MPLDLFNLTFSNLSAQGIENLRRRMMQFRRQAGYVQMTPVVEFDQIDDLTSKRIAGDHQDRAVIAPEALVFSNIHMAMLTSVATLRQTRRAAIADRVQAAAFTLRRKA